MFCFFFSDMGCSFGKVSNKAEYEGLFPKENKIHLQITVVHFWVQQVLHDSLPLVTHADKDGDDGCCTVHIFFLLGCQLK